MKALITTGLSEGSRHDDHRRQQAMPIHLSNALFGVAALASFALSVTLWFAGSEQQGIFVGLWVPSILALGAFATSAAQARG